MRLPSWPALFLAACAPAAAPEVQAPRSARTLHPDAWEGPVGTRMHTVGCGGDFDGDGYDDLLATSLLDLYVYAGGADFPAEPVELTILNATLAICPGDIDGDGYEDAIIDHFSEWTLHLGSPAGLESDEPWSAQTRHDFLDAGDFDADGHIDVVTSNAKGDLAVYRNTGTGVPGTPGKTFALRGDYSSVAVDFVRLGDFDGDGEQEVLVAGVFADYTVSDYTGTTRHLKRDGYGAMLVDLASDVVTPVGTIYQDADEVLGSSGQWELADGCRGSVRPTGFIEQGRTGGGDAWVAHDLVECAPASTEDVDRHVRCTAEGCAGVVPGPNVISIDLDGDGAVEHITGFDGRPWFIPAPQWHDPLGSEDFGELVISMRPGTVYPPAVLDFDGDGREELVATADWRTTQTWLVVQEDDSDDDGFDHTEDCDDFDPAVYPGADDGWYDGIDSDCDGADDFDQDGDGARSGDYGGTDCDDLDPQLGPHATEVPGDGIDTDCDGQELCFVDQDRDGYRSADARTVGSPDLSCATPGLAPLTRSGGDCDDDDSDVNPGADEIIGDGSDQDCDGQELCFEDADEDGVRTEGTRASTDPDCDDPGEASATTPAGDCNDATATVYPGAEEVPGDGIDQDCDGEDPAAAGGGCDSSGVGGGLGWAVALAGLLVRRRWVRRG